jgi:hypothetical protein
MYKLFIVLVFDCARCDSDCEFCIAHVVQDVYMHFRSIGCAFDLMLDVLN